MSAIFNGPLVIKSGVHRGQDTRYEAYTPSLYQGNTNLNVLIEIPNASNAPILPEGTDILAHGRVLRARRVGQDVHIVLLVADPGVCFKRISPEVAHKLTGKFCFTGYLHEVIPSSRFDGPARIKLEIEKFEDANPFLISFRLEGYREAEAEALARLPRSSFTVNASYHSAGVGTDGESLLLIFYPHSILQSDPYITTDEALFIFPSSPLLPLPQFRTGAALAHAVAPPTYRDAAVQTDGIAPLHYAVPGGTLDARLSFSTISEDVVEGMLGSASSVSSVSDDSTRSGELDARLSFSTISEDAVEGMLRAADSSSSVDTDLYATAPSSPMVLTTSLLNNTVAGEQSAVTTPPDSPETTVWGSPEQVSPSDFSPSAHQAGGGAAAASTKVVAHFDVASSAVPALLAGLTAASAGDRKGLLGKRARSVQELPEGGLVCEEAADPALKRLKGAPSA